MSDSAARVNLKPTWRLISAAERGAWDRSEERARELLAGLDEEELVEAVSLARHVLDELGAAQ